MPFDYEDARRHFTWRRPERFNFVADVMADWATRTPDALALLWTDADGTVVRLSFADMLARARQAAAVLAAAGVRRGDTVLVILSRELPWWELMLACLQLGAVASPGTTQLSAKDIGYRLRASGATAVISNRDCAGHVEQALIDSDARPALLHVDGPRHGWTDYTAARAAATPLEAIADTAADEDALCYFTSGTTGYPKMTVHGHGYPLGHEVTGRFWLDLRPGDLHWNLSDTGWAKAAWSSLFAPWLMGAAMFVHHAHGFDATATLDLLEAHPITTLCAPPTAYRMFVQQDLSARRFQALRHCVGAGEPLNPEVIAAWSKATGLAIMDGYGQTETILLCGNFQGVPVRAGSMGKPSPGIELAVIDEAGQPLPPDTEGDIALRVAPVRPMGLFKGYRGDPDRTASVFRGDWYLTGDRATVDADGYFWFVGRADDVILSSGYRIGPFEVESALIEHPAVAESAVVASPDPTRGEVVKAFVILAPGFTGSDALVKELQDHVKAVTAPYKYPRKIEFVTSLPKTVSGKIMRKDLRAKEWAGHQ